MLTKGQIEVLDKLRDKYKNIFSDNEHRHRI